MTHPASSDTRLASFIRGNMKPIIDDWSSFARNAIPATARMSREDVEDHVRQLLTCVADDLETPQTEHERQAKSKGDGPKSNGETSGETPAELHGFLRLRDGFDINEMVSEYRALRASVIRLWQKANPDAVTSVDLEDLVRFNEAIDQACNESVQRFSDAVTNSRSLFLGVVGHDLRNPLCAVEMGLRMVLRDGGNLDEGQTMILTQVLAATKRAGAIVSDLFDLTREAVGSELPVHRVPTNLSVVARQIVEEMRLFHPEQDIELIVDGDLTGDFDAARVGQVLSNLTGNAIMHGASDEAVRVSLTGENRHCVLRVRNGGKVLSDECLQSISEDHVGGREASSSAAHMGLGLYITRKLVAAHNGSMTITSSSEDGTVFSVRLPRKVA